MNEMRFTTESLVESDPVETEVMDEMLEPARPFSMPSEKKPIGKSGGLLAGVLVCIMLMSGGLLAWSAFISQDDAVAVSTSQDQIDSKQPQYKSAMRLQCAVSADGFS